MSTLTTRAGKGLPLTFSELDANFTNLNADKYQAGDAASLASLTLSSRLGVGVTTPSFDVSFEGTTAHTLGMERNTTADTAGRNLTISAGGATSGGTNRNGGFLILSGGTSTGAGGSNIYFYTAPNAASGTADNAPIERMRLTSTGSLGIGTASPTAKLHVAEGTALIVRTSGIASCQVWSNQAAGYAPAIANLTRTDASAGATPDNSVIGEFRFDGRDSTAAYSGFAYITAGIGVNAAGGAPSFITFHTGASGAQPTEKFRVTSAGNLGVATTNPSYIISMGGNAARTVGMERHTTANTAGNDLTVLAGGATSGATDKAGGSLILSSGTSTGTGASIITFLTAAAGTAGTTSRTPAERARIDGAGNLLMTSSGGLGYGTGSGGAVTQATSRTTGVTLHKTNGAITLVSAAGTTAWQTFTVTNSTVAATDTLIVNQQSGADLYQIFVTTVAAGSFKITFATTGGTTTEQPVFNFAVIKAVTA